MWPDILAPSFANEVNTEKLFNFLSLSNPICRMGTTVVSSGVYCEDTVR